MLIIILRCIYLLLFIPLVVYAISTLCLLFIYFRHVRTPQPRPAAPPLVPPTVTVQIPLYNERYVARRAIEAAAALDYPRDRLTIQVLDDSTDDTSLLIANLVETLRGQGVQIEHIRRTERTGYKSGALANGLSQTTSDLVAVFDADFIPPADFLQRTVPFFGADPRLGVVQARWGHLNAEDNVLTRSQAMIIDGHFAVEQQARFHGGLFVSFNGTGGIWRRECIVDAGGWASDTLAEDTDLSFRAQIRGWRIVYVRDVVIPGEISPQMNGFKQQQARWSKGTTQVLLKLAWPLLRSQLDPAKRIMGLMQLLAYPSQLMALCLLTIMPMMVLTDALHSLPLAPLGIIGLSIPMMYIAGQVALYPDWLRRSLYFPALLAISSGMTFNNGAAVLSALFGRATEFKRTPKFMLGPGGQGEWRESEYAVLVDRNIFWELAYGVYSVAGALIAARYSPSLVLYFGVYAVGFLAVAAWSYADNRGARRAQSVA